MGNVWWFDFIFWTGGARYSEIFSLKLNKKLSMTLLQHDDFNIVKTKKLCTLQPAATYLNMYSRNFMYMRLVLLHYMVLLNFSAQEKIHIHIFLREWRGKTFPFFSLAFCFNFNCGGQLCLLSVAFYRFHNKTTFSSSRACFLLFLPSQFNGDFFPSSFLDSLLYIFFNTQM